MVSTRAGAALLAVLLPLVAAPVERPVDALNRRNAACKPVQGRVRALLAEQGSACTADWECERQSPWLLGCGAWARRGFQLPAELAEELDAACGPFSFDEPCDRKVGACVEGRCQGRAPTLQGCEAARAALVSRLAEPAACERHSDCDERAHPRERHAMLDACWNEPGSEQPPANFQCVERRCQPAADAQAGGKAPGTYQRPTLVEPGCIVRGLSGLAAAGYFTPTEFKAKFAVTVGGEARGLSILDADRAVDRLAVAQVLAGCKFRPGLGPDGKPVRIWVVMPIRFRGP